MIVEGESICDECKGDKKIMLEAVVDSSKNSQQNQRNFYRNFIEYY